MTKNEFIAELSGRLSSFPRNEAEKSISYFSEIIDDKLDDGSSEEQAIESLGDMDDIVKNIMLDASFTAIIKTKAGEKKKRSTAGTVLLWVGSPLWLTLLIAAVAVFTAVYVSIWSVIIAVWSAMGTLAATGIACIPAAIVTMTYAPFNGIFGLGAAFVLIGLSVFMFFAAKRITVWCIKLTVIFVRFVKNIIIGKRSVKK